MDKWLAHIALSLLLIHRSGIVSVVLVGITGPSFIMLVDQSDPVKDPWRSLAGTVSLRLCDL